MKPKMAFLRCAGILVICSSTAHAVGGVSPGKNSAFLSTNPVAITTSTSTVGTVQLLKGKKRNVIKFDVTLVETGTSTNKISISASINGVAVDPAVAQGVENCTNSVNNCTAQAQYWADLDALETLYPGQFVGQMLTIDAQASASSATNAYVSVRARLIKP